MNNLDWQQKFESGNQLIDIQHRQLFEKIGSCIEAARDGLPGQELATRLQDIQQCLLRHLSHEERLMKGSSQEISDHKSQHAYITNQLDRELMKFSTRAEGRNSIQGILFNLHDWYMIHLDAEDDYWRHHGNSPSDIG